MLGYKSVGRKRKREESLCYGGTPEDAEGGANFISKPVSLDFPCFENLEVSEDLRQSLEKISTAAVECTNLWNNKITSFGNLVPLSEFQKLLESHGLLWHKNVVSENDVEVTANHLRSRVNERAYKRSRILPDLTSGSLWQKASKDFSKVCCICHQLERNFNGEQVGQLASFLDYLIMMQEEQRLVAYSFHVFDGLYVISRESSSLLKEAEDKSDGCSTVNDKLHKILGIIKDKEFMNARQLIGRSCGCNSDLLEFPAGERFQVFLASKSMKQLLLSTFKRLDQLHFVLQGQSFSKSSVTEKLIGCLYDVLNKGKLIEKEYFDGLEHKNKLLQETGSLVDTEVVSEIEFVKSVKKTLKQIDEAVQKLVLLRGSILSEDSPHGNITLWRVLYESSLVNLQLDLICENLGRTIELRVRIFTLLVFLMCHFCTFIFAW
ncbi:hypothetical protein MKW92_025623 [Papaver armeniacum]|nr:hypothetical protein MKW92_025623 [Papaver armeniacum]